MSLQAVLDAIAADWVALVPTTRPEARYHALDGMDAPGDSELGSLVTDLHADRGFSFGERTGAVVQEYGDAVSLVSYQVTATLFLGMLQVGRADVLAVAQDEISRLRRAVDNRANFGAGVREVITTSTTIGIVDEEAGLAAATLQIQCLVEEDDE